MTARRIHLYSTDDRALADAVCAYLLSDFPMARDGKAHVREMDEQEKRFWGRSFAVSIDDGDTNDGTKGYWGQYSSTIDKMRTAVTDWRHGYEEGRIVRVAQAIAEGEFMLDGKKYIVKEFKPKPLKHAFKIDAFCEWNRYDDMEAKEVTVTKHIAQQPGEDFFMYNVRDSWGREWQVHEAELKLIVWRKGGKSLKTAAEVRGTK